MSDAPGSPTAERHVVAVQDAEIEVFLGGDRMKSIMPLLWGFDSRAWIGSVRLPALVLCGTADPVVPVRHARAVHEAIAGSVFVEIEGAGHVPTGQRRPEVADAFQRFASRLGPAKQSG
jgi:pimeloyl-[acyl-carrier protein] methyl ester esterase